MDFQPTYPDDEKLMAEFNRTVPAHTLRDISYGTHTQAALHNFRQRTPPFSKRIFYLSGLLGGVKGVLDVSSLW